jgi:hypothetical protein
MPPAAATGTRHDIERGARRAVTAGLGALRDQNICTRFKRLPRHLLGLNLADQQRARRLDARRERVGIAERKHNRARTGSERDVQQLGLFGEAPGDEADAEGVGDVGELGGLLLQPCFVAIAAAENAEPAGRTDRGCQACARNDVHRRQQDRMPDAEASGQWR